MSAFTRTWYSFAGAAAAHTAARRLAHWRRGCRLRRASADRQGADNTAPWHRVWKACACAADIGAATGKELARAPLLQSTSPRATLFRTGGAGRRHPWLHVNISGLRKAGEVASRRRRLANDHQAAARLLPPPRPRRLMETYCEMRWAHCLFRSMDCCLRHDSNECPCLDV
jgi:hypothetical protein